MNIKSGIKSNVVVLIVFLTLGILAQYVPHHHHEGRFCLEETENFTHDTDSEDDCQLICPNIADKGISKISSSFVPDILYFTLLFYFDLSKDYCLQVIYPSYSPLLKTKPYSLNPHKLRGSPLFS